MNPALLTLMRLQYRGLLRRTTRTANSPRRAVFLAIGVLVIAVWLLSSMVPVLQVVAVKNHHSEQIKLWPQRLRDVMPLVLAGVCVLTIVSSAGDKAIAFTAGEVDMLFPGPFSRRQLLFYKLLKSALAALLTGLFLSVFLLIYAGSWLGGYVGIVLTLLFIQLFSTAGVLLGQTIGQQAQSRVRRAVLIIAVIGGLLVARHLITTGGGMQAVYRLRNTELGGNLLAPFDPFGRMITANTLDGFFPAAIEATLIDLGLLAIVVLLDANYLEAATGASRRRYAQLQRIRSGSLLSAGVKGNAAWRLPQLPRLGGAGPIIWRQATSAGRSARGLLLVLLLIGVAVGPLFGSALRTANITQPLLAGMAWLTVLLSGLLKFDFRGDLDHMDELKALPLRPAALAAGQVVVPTLILTAAHVLLLISISAVGTSHRDILVVAAFLALPFNALLMSLENLIFLLFPTRPAAASPGDFQMIGRQAAQLMMKGLAVAIGVGIALAVAVPVYILTGGSLVVLTVLAWIVMGAEVVALVPFISWAFTRFDPSIDTPA
ncbi:MAG TPA: putative ABC exporter domain-containing protein [Tepidisphaeraceae bacterium]|nr:putative ABC exporter domain-containing protein [Tepidisphaeraceae bacterium]